MSQFTVSRVYRFGQYRLDAAARELRRGDEELTLPPKAFACLLYLVEHRDRAVGREELLEGVWNHAHLTDSALDQAIFLVRRALGDTAETQRHVKTVRGFGYHWVVPTQVETDRPDPGRRWPPWIWPAAVTLIAVALWLLLSRPWHGDAESPVELAHWVAAAGDIALVLPVVVDHAEGQSWIRLGAMELIAERLRAADQPVVPSETVIVLMQRLTDTPDRDALDWLYSTAGVRLVFEARAERRQDAWRVSLHTRGVGVPSLSALGEADEVLEAARIAADRMALSLGLTPAPEPDAEPGLTVLVQQLQAAILAGQREVARDLVERAPPEMRAHPEVRFQLARLDLYSADLRNMDAAESALEALLATPEADRDAVFRARILVALGGVYHARGDDDGAEQILRRALGLLDGQRRPDRMCDIWNNLSLLAIRRGAHEAAREYVVQGRAACEAVGNLEGIANADHHLGGMEMARERYADAAFYFERAAGNFAALHSIDGELWARVNTLAALLEQLDLPAATAVERRVSELREQATAPALRRYADLIRAQFLDASGDLVAAEALLAGLVADGEGPARRPYHAEPLVLQAERAIRVGDYARAAELTADVFGQQSRGLIGRLHGRARLVEVRAHLALGDLAAAADAAAAMADWTADDPAPSAAIHLALIDAELAAAGGDDDAAQTRFERALTLAEAQRVPRYLLQVAERYVDWLLAGDVPDTTRALVVSSYVDQYAERDYHAALLGLRTAHAAAVTATWRMALDRARPLAGERQIPEALLVAPEATAP